ncbi:VTT domain-containing protein [Mycolicibacterium arenosum]|uniref:VTT domain-containing protein n=1 Tax=Mycolicibacterium arenosum TaxID=2952157 RepID=A0ABT1M919_9MYCO|nr:VTT domain-containing protein [Mycolicibacterium sp. CAU 1645]MCP9275040.1 VTT domain-containing protein [Mycolicibacterium sp. CAU 1645]
MTTSVLALPAVLDPMYWLGDGGLFASAVLPGVMIIVFIETGLLFPFLPGDTLLFTAGLIAAQENSPVTIWTLAPSAAVAAVAGGQLGYLIGRTVGPALFTKEDARIFKKHYLETSHRFFERHGRKTIVIGHFVGVVRTFTPVIAGASGMPYRVFLAYDIVGAVAWGVGLTLVGYHLGGVPFVSTHLEWIVLAIAVLSALPVVGSVLRAAVLRRRAVSAAASP